MDASLKVYSNPTYNSWAMARKRCAGNTPKRKRDYTDRGITFDPAWDDFDVFLRDMGPRPDGMTLDRKDNDKGYTAGNCQWATPKWQAYNRRCVKRKRELKLYIDLDGVLADFDKSAEAILKTNNIYKYEFIWGPDVFWQKINEYPTFFRDLELKEDARWLWAKVEHLKPTILTALPRENGERVDIQKRAWVFQHFKIQGERVITCPTKDKPKFCQPGDILIDDRAVNRDAWMKAGGTYIIHTKTERTLGALEALGII